MTNRGRPTLYSDDILVKANDYLNNFDKEPYEDKIPMICGLSLAIGVSRETIYTWSKQEDKEEFSDIVRQVLRAQEKTLLNNGLGGTFNASITKLALSKHGYSDKVDTTIANPDGTNLESSTDLEIARKLAYAIDKALKAKQSE